MKLPKIVVKDKRGALLAAVAGLGVILLAYGILRSTGLYRLPPRLDNELPNYIIFAAFAAFLYGRQITKDEEKAAKKEAEEKAAEAKAAEEGGPAAASGEAGEAGDAEGGAGESRAPEADGEAGHRG